MAEIVLTTEIPREKGFLYYVSSNEKGNLIICRNKAGRKPTEEKK